MKPMDTIQDLIEEAKLRTVWWALCIFAVTYFLSHTSKSMMMNIPIAIFFVSLLRIVFNEVEFRRKDKSFKPKTYLSLLEKKQLSLNDSRLSTPPPSAKWKRNIGSPVVEAAANEFIHQILKDFVVDLWYSDITPDRDFPEHIHGIILDAIGEISGRVKELNLVDLLTRDIVDLVGDHIDVFRRIQASIGPDVMRTLSSEERDERLKYHLMVSKELHPALVSPESEYKVLQRLVGGLIALVLRQREAQVPVVRSIARELVTCLVVQPLLNFASPIYVNEVLELIFLALKDDYGQMVGLGGDQIHRMPVNPNLPASASSLDSNAFNKKPSPSTNQENTSTLAQTGHHRAATNWARGLEAATQRRTEVLMPENLENMWAKGRNYKRKEAKRAKGVKNPLLAGALPKGEDKKELHVSGSRKSITSDEKNVLRLNPSSVLDSPLSVESDSHMDASSIDKRELSFETNSEDDLEGTPDNGTNGRRNRLKRSNSTSALRVLPESKKPFAKEGGGPIISEFYSPIGNHSEEKKVKTMSDVIYRTEGPPAPKLRCRVMGAYFEKLGSKSFAVYSIAVTDTESRTWFVKRRYSNFERLHRHLKEIPNYTLHLPPKRIFSSSTEDAFVHQRCIQLDKYLQDLLSIANVAEQHEVWDFLSASSKSYSFGKSSSVMRSLAVNVDDAVDDIVRQFKGVSNGLMRSLVTTPSASESSDMVPGKSLSWQADDIDRQFCRQSTSETLTSNSDIEESQRDGNYDHQEEGPSTSPNGWHSDNELNSKQFPPRVVKHGEEIGNSNSNMKQNTAINSEGRDAAPALARQKSSEPWGGPAGMPPEWTPPNVCVPMLNLVDKVFQLKRRGWLRRQVFWMSKQILQLVMEDAIDDWLLRQIQWLRCEDTVAKGIRWVQDLLWPGGKFFINLRNTQSNTGDDEKLFGAGDFGGSRASKEGTFESQLEAARRASDVKKMLFDGPPAALVSLVGPKQYRRCARDIYYFSQSTICIKQLAYGVLELLLISVFPELRDLVVDVRQKTAPQEPENAA